jgi:hypothetical protein
MMAALQMDPQSVTEVMARFFVAARALRWAADVVRVPQRAERLGARALPAALGAHRAAGYAPRAQLLLHARAL